jgi:hypothetical protein
MKGKRERKEREGKEIKKLIERFSRVFPMLFGSVFTSWLSFIFLFFFGRQQAKKTEKEKKGRVRKRWREERRSNMVLRLIRLSIEFGMVSLLQVVVDQVSSLFGFFGDCEKKRKRQNSWKDRL